MLLILASCTSYDELWTEAEATGDWSKVQAYEDKQRKKRQQIEVEKRFIASCKAQKMAVYCSTSQGINYETDCVCVPRP